MREIVCVCFGNICRSPMMEALLEQALDKRFGEGNFVITGGGVGADDGRPPSQGTVRAMSRRGLDVRKHRSRRMTRQIAKDAWLIYATEEYQVLMIQELLPPEEHWKVRLMGGEEVPDPYGSNDAAYEDVAIQVERLIGYAVTEIEATVAENQSDR